MKKITTAEKTLRLTIYSCILLGVLSGPLYALQCPEYNGKGTERCAPQCAYCTVVEGQKYGFCPDGCPSN